MKTTRTIPQDIDAYIAVFAPAIQEILLRIRATIRQAAPDAQERIAYQMPTFVLGGKTLVHFAAFKNHIGFYPTPTGTEKFQKELASYKHAKGSVQFPIKDEIPYQLIRKIVKFRKNKSQKS